jgi:alpha-D-ribose 1-methylphosphonate 5-triphosphate diphosphatase
MASLRITGGRVLAGNTLADVDLLIEDGRITGFDTGNADTSFDARGLLVLPAIVDIHGDAFERQLQPRPGVDFPADLALAETERQLLANGITTAFHGVTLSWEPGLRSLETWRAVLDALHGRRWTCDMRVHLRWEAYNLPALDTALADIEAGRVHLLAFNDHTPAILRRLSDPEKAVKYSERGPMTLAEFRAVAEQAAARKDEVPVAIERIGAAARAANLPIASHDDDSPATRDAFRARGARICEFPMSEEVARYAAAAGDAVVMGSPNVVRGKSHLGWAAAARLAEAGICTVLSSDYYYPCLLQAPFILARRGVLDFARAWALVSANPAAAAFLPDRGSIAPGNRADLLLIDQTNGTPHLVAALVKGTLAHAGAGAEARLRAMPQRTTVSVGS